MNKNNFLIPIITVIVINLTALVVLWFLYSHVSKERNELIKINSEVVVDEQRQERLRSLKDLISGIDKEREMINSAFVDETSLIEFIEELERISDISGTGLEISSAKLPDGDSSKVPEFRFVVEGSFPQIFRYLSLLENTRYQIKVDDAQVFRISEEDSGWRGSFKIELLSFIKNG